MQNDNAPKDVKQLAGELERDLLDLYGSPILTGEHLKSAMGYRSVQALRQAMTRGTFPVNVFTIANRRGRFALAKDVAYWLAKQRIENIENEQMGGKR